MVHSSRGVARGPQVGGDTPTVTVSGIPAYGLAGLLAALLLVACAGDEERRASKSNVALSSGTSQSIGLEGGPLVAGFGDRGLTQGSGAAAATGE